MGLPKGGGSDASPREKGGVNHLPISRCRSSFCEKSKWTLAITFILCCISIIHAAVTCSLKSSAWKELFGGLLPAATTTKYELIAALSHHKSGTYQMRCLTKQMAAATQTVWPNTKCFGDVGAPASWMLNCLHQSPVKPAYFRASHGIKHHCRFKSGDKEPTPYCTTFQRYKACLAKPESIQALQQPMECVADLPAPEDLSVGIINVVRNPIDAVISAFDYHRTLPMPKDEEAPEEGWLWESRKVNDVLRMLSLAGADRETLVFIGKQRKRGPTVTHQSLLRRLPLERSVILDFWHSLPNLRSMERQHISLMRVPSAFNARFEDLRDSFNATVDAISQHVGIEPRGVLIDMAVADGCNPMTWTEERRAQDAHITSGKRQEAQAAAAKALLKFAPAKNILCSMVKSLGYKDARCSSL